MRFALLGDHPDGLDMAAALATTGRHELAVYSGPAAAAEALQARGLVCKSVGDVEEVLADPAITAVIVAGRPSVRAQQLRRALQSERHVLCVHPPDPSPDVGYEAALIQADTRHVLLPLLAEALHPAVIRLAEWVCAKPGEPSFNCLQIERWVVGPLFTESGRKFKPSFPDWAILRALGGEVAEVSAFASGEEIGASEPLLLSGRFEQGGVFQSSIVPGRPWSQWRVQVIGNDRQAELLFPQGQGGPARMEWRDGAGEMQTETWEAWSPWPALVSAFETAVEAYPRPVRTRPAWQDSVRSLELDDAARRSVERRRSSTLDYQEVSEAVGFKGTMTLVGCGMLWGLLALLILGNWFRPAFWAIPVLLAAFLGMQLLRAFLPGSTTASSVDAEPEP